MTQEDTANGDGTTQDPAEDVQLTPEEEAEQAPAKQSFEEKMATATTDAERVAIATAEANKNRRLLAKAAKPKPVVAAAPAVQTTPQAQTPVVDVDERVLKAQGMSDELLKQLKDVAALREVSLIDAQKDDLFVAIKEKFDKEQKTKAAALPPSRGSGSKKADKDLSTPGLTRDEHKALVMGK